MTGCVAQQEGDKIRERAPMVDVVIGTQALAKLPEAVETARETWEPYVDVNPYDNVSFPLGIAARHDPVKAFVTIIEGCNDFCAFCVVPYTRGHERMRAAAEIVAEVEEVASQGHREVQLLGQIVNHYQAPDIPGCDFAGLLERVHDVPGIAPHPVCESSPTTRHAAHDRSDAGPPEGLQALAPPGSVGVDTRARTDAPPAHPRTILGPGRRGSRGYP